jgi:hypothetical protein
MKKAIKNKSRSGDVPIGLTAAFYEDPIKNNLWNGFSKRSSLTIPVGNLTEVVVELRKHLLPVFEKAAQGRQ